MKAKVYRLNPDTGKYEYSGIKRRSSKILDHVPLSGTCDPFNTLGGGEKGGINVPAIKNFLARDEANNI